MKQDQQQDHQQQQQQQQWDGEDRRHEPQGDFRGDERRKPTPGMSAQERKDAQEKAQQEREHKTD